MNGHIGALAIIASLGLTTVAATPVMAGDQSKPVVVTGHDDDIITRRVSYADLDLTIKAQQKTLFKRVGYAVRKVCFDAVGPNAMDWADMKCRSNAWSGAKPQIANAIDRASDLALYGHSDIAPVAIRVSVGQ